MAFIFFTAKEFTPISPMIRVVGQAGETQRTVTRE